MVGIGGLPRSGKDALAEMFLGSGYFGMSFGDLVRSFAMLRHADKPDPISVANMTETSNWLRQTRGADFALKELLSRYEKDSKKNSYKGILAWSVRAPVEVDYILKHEGHLIWVESSDEIRYKRAMQNLRQGEIEISLEEFRRKENEQWMPNPNLPEGIQMNVSYVKTKATDILENDFDNLEEFRKQAKILIDKL